MEGTPSGSWRTKPSWSACPQSWILPRLRRFCAPALPPIPLYAAGRWARGRE
jgi:hypothetical protein